MKQKIFVRINSNFENFTRFYSFEQRKIEKSIANRKKKNKIFEKIEKKKTFKKNSTMIKSITLYFLHNNLRLINVSNKSVYSKSQKFEQKNFNNF